MNSHLKIFFSISLTAFFFSSCKKEKEYSRLQINILSPASLSEYMPGDTIEVEAILTDEGGTENLTMKLLNTAYISVCPQISIGTNGQTSYHLVEKYVIDNMYLESGHHYFTITSSDEGAIQSEYKIIVIHEIPKTTKAVYVLSRPDLTNVSVSKLDSTGVLLNQFTVPGDYSASAINSRYNELMVAGKQTGSFSQYDLENNSIIFSELPYNGNGPSFQNLFFYNNLTFVSFYDGRIKAYDQNGAVKFNSSQPVYYQPGALCAGRIYIFAEAFYPGPNETRLVTINNPSGVAKQEYNLGIDMTNIFSKSDFETVIFGNDGADGKIYSYNAISNDADDLHSIFSAHIYSAAMIDNDNYAIATQNGLYSYQLSTNNLIPVDLNQPVYSVEYDNVNGVLYTATGKTIREYAFPNPQVINTLTSIDSVLDVRILYSK